MSFWLKFRVTLLCLMLAALAVLWLSPTTVERLGDAWTWYAASEETMVASDEATQFAVAMHEASHAVTSRVLRGAGSVRWIKVYESAVQTADGRTVGRTGSNVAIRPGTRHDALNVAAMFFAGGIGERLAVRMRHDSDGSDTMLANAAVYVFLARLNVAEPSDAYAQMTEAVADSPELAVAMFEQTAAAIACAEAVVEENKAVIGELALVTLKQPVRWGRRFMDDGDLASFWESHPTRKPLGICVF